MRVDEVMQRDVASLESGERLDLAQDIMRLGRVRHMPVLARGKLVGLVSDRDLLAASLSKALDFGAQERRNFLRSVPVDQVMSTALITVRPDADLREAARTMLGRKVGCLLVTDEAGELLGILTESDLVRAAWA